MTSPEPTLDSLRAQVDRIDDQLHDLIMKRCALVERLGELKGEGLALRPGRDAAVLRRLVARHRGNFPKAALVRLWREMIGAMLGIQQPLTIAVAQSERGDGFIELCRNHFGVVWPVIPTPSAGQVIKLVSDGQASVGVVPLPGHGPGGAEPWWVALNGERDTIPRVVARLPAYPADSRPEPLQALVIARRGHDDTGFDRTLVVAETAASTSRDRVRTLFAAAGLDSIEILAIHTVDGTVLHLVDIEGWIGHVDPRLAALVRDPVRHASVIGGYPVPLSP